MMLQCFCTDYGFYILHHPACSLESFSELVLVRGWVWRMRMDMTSHSSLHYLSFFFLSINVCSPSYLKMLALHKGMRKTGVQ